MQHRKHGRGANTCAQQDHRSFPGSQRKATTRGTDIEGVARAQMIVNIRADHAVRFALHTYPVRSIPRRV